MSELPDSWIKAPLGCLLSSIVGGGTPSKANADHFRGAIPFMTVKDMHARFIEDTQDHITEAALADSASTLIPADTLIVASRMSLGKVARPNVPVAINQDLKALFLHSGVSKTYVEYLWRANEERIRGLGTGTTVKGIRLEDIRGLEVPIAPSNEQVRIADQLNTLLARVNVCNEHLEAIPGILKRFRQVVLNAAAGAHFLGNAPEAPLRVVQLHTVLAEPLRNGKSVRDGAGLSVLRLTSLKPSGLDLKESKAGDWSAVSDVGRFLIQNGDYLVSRGNGSKDRVGLGGLVHGCKEDLAFPDTMIRIRPDHAKLLPEYLNYVWSSQLVRQQIEHVAKTTTGIWKVSQPDLERISFPLPNLDEQLEIVSRVDGLLKLANRIEARYAAMRAHAQRLAPQVLAKAFRGELVQQDPQDEPASLLLGKLRAVRANAAADRSKDRTKTPGKRPIMSNADIDSIKAAIMNLESDRFSFDELKERITCDYETLKTSLFALLEEPKPVVRQVFDEECKEVRFVRVRT